MLYVTKVFYSISLFLIFFSFLFHYFLNPHPFKVSTPATGYLFANTTATDESFVPKSRAEESFVQFSAHFKYSEANSLVNFAPPSPSGCPRNIVFGKTDFRLGNLMCGYATYLAFTLHTNRTPVISRKTFNTLNSYFQHIKIKSEAAIKRNPGCQFNYKSYNDEGKGSVAKWHADFKKFQNKNIKTVGAPYHLGPFSRFRTELMESFQLRTHHRVKVEKILREIKSCRGRNCTYVCVHVRRTDQKRLVRRLYKGKLIGKEYIYNAMKLMKRKFPNSVFLVISDDMKWCMKYLRFREFQIEFIHKNPITDLGLLMYSNHSIITHGTFGYIGAFLSGGHVIQPKKISKAIPDLEAVGKRLKNWIQINGFP